MSKKERLLDLLYKYEFIEYEAMSHSDYDSDKAMEACADFLLKNNVTFADGTIENQEIDDIRDMVIAGLYKVCLTKGFSPDVFSELKAEQTRLFDNYMANRKDLKEKLEDEKV